MKQLIECVPNFSEGRDMDVIRQITGEIEAIDGVKLLDVDPGKATNRTVVTFVGEPGPVMDAAFVAIRKAAELIDMSKHHGEHPRFGATDVCPFVPISSITMKETAEYARQLAKRVGEALSIPVYCYENAALTDERRNLAVVRSGEYEGLQDKLAKPEWKPDFGPATFNPGTGATAVGARNVLIAYNVNLNSTSVRRANAIAYDVREKGRTMREGNSVNGKIVRDANGKAMRTPGSLQSVKAIGWFIEEYGIAQISMNLTDTTVTPLHVAFDEVCEKARLRGVRVTGSEVVGLVPLQTMIDAGKYFMHKQHRSGGLSRDELIRLAVKSMGLDELAPFNPKEKIIELALAGNETKLVDMSVAAFTDETSSESPAPGGGSISAAVGAMGAALATMVANLSSHKHGWDERWQEFSDWAEKGRGFVDELSHLVDEDTHAFNQIMAAIGLPKDSKEEKAIRKQAISEATLYAIEVPFRVMKAAYGSMEVIQKMAEIGNPNSVSDAGVGALCARTAVLGAYMNVKINAAGITNDEFVKTIMVEGAEIERQTIEKEAEIIALVNSRMP